MNLQRIKYRLRFYWGKVCAFCGLCASCGSKVNYTRSGAVCSNCRKRY